jgi:Bacteriocin-protection, YdeI or OmpD-Associated/Domain of unknown function (DUF1905)
MSSAGRRSLSCMRFHSTLELGGKTATGIPVPPEVVAALGSHKRPAVRVTLGSHSYRSTVAPMRGRFMLPVSAENRALAGVEAGDELDVEIELDTAPRELVVPADFATALDAAPEARERFDALSFSRRQWFVLGIEGAKQEATRKHRIEKAIVTLREG